MSSSAVHSQIDVRELLPRGTSSNAERRSWFAVFTIPQNEKSVVRHLEFHGMSSRFSHLRKRPSVEESTESDDPGASLPHLLVRAYRST